MLDIILPIVSAVLAATIAVLVTSYYYRRRTLLRVQRLNLYVKQHPLTSLERGLVAGELRDLNDLLEPINQITAEWRAVVQRVTAERNAMAALLENMTDGIINTDADGMVMGLNQAARRVLGLSDKIAVENRTLMQVVRDHEVNAQLRQTFQDGQERVKVLEVGPHRLQLQVKTTLVEEQGEIGPVTRTGLVVLQDLTELHRLERVRRDFVANISHELRTPLASVKLMVETLQAVLEDDPIAAHDFLTRIDTEIDGLTQLVRELLELSRIESGQIKLNLKAIDLRELVEQSAERLRPQAERRGLSLISGPNGGEEFFPPALVDPDRIMQVLINLIHNAIKFTPVGGCITMGVSRYRDADSKDEKLLVQVCDTGVGIPPDEVSRIFERFYKVDKARAGTEAGTGLGLAISKHVVQAHGGEIWAESEFGRGSVFSFTVPVFLIV